MLQGPDFDEILSVKINFLEAHMIESSSSFNGNEHVKVLALGCENISSANHFSKLETLILYAKHGSNLPWELSKKIHEIHVKYGPKFT